MPTQELSLPQVFWEDLVEVVKLVVVAQGSQFQTLQGQYLVDQVQPFIVQVRQLLDRSTDHPGWSNEARTETKAVLAKAYRIVGDQAGQNSFLKSAIDLYREVLQERTRERVPLEWAGTQNNLGTALTSLGEREAGTARLEEAVAAYRAALQEFTPEDSSYYFYMANENLKKTLSVLKERGEGRGT